MDALKKKLGAHHHFTTPYCPWANGTVEVVNRSILRTVKTLLSEMKLHFDEWPSLLLQVQSALNHLPADRLGGVTPSHAMTKLDDATPLTIFMHPITNHSQGRHDRLVQGTKTEGIGTFGYGHGPDARRIGNRQ